MYQAFLRSYISYEQGDVKMSKQFYVKLFNIFSRKYRIVFSRPHSKEFQSFMCMDVLIDSDSMPLFFDLDTTDTIVLNKLIEWIEGRCQDTFYKIKTFKGFHIASHRDDYSWENVCNILNESMQYGIDPGYVIHSMGNGNYQTNENYGLRCGMKYSKSDMIFELKDIIFSPLHIKYIWMSYMYSRICNVVLNVITVLRYQIGGGVYGLIE